MKDRIKDFKGIKWFEVDWGEKAYCSFMDLENAIEFFHMKVKRPQKLFVYVSDSPIEVVRKDVQYDTTKTKDC